MRGASSREQLHESRRRDRPRGPTPTSERSRIASSRDRSRRRESSQGASPTSSSFRDRSRRRESSQGASPTSSSSRHHLRRASEKQECSRRLFSPDNAENEIKRDYLFSKIDGFCQNSNLSKQFLIFTFHFSITKNWQ